MTVATLLLDMKDNYVSADGKLPPRPKWDKRLLAAIVELSVISPEAAVMLPPSMCGGMIDEKYTLPITIREISDTADLLIVTRSYNIVKDGKVFRLNEYEQIVKSGQLEIYVRRH